jgi:hypothetical protein
MDKAVNGLECYVFVRRYRDGLQVFITPVSTFWNHCDPLAGPFVLKNWEQ